MPPDMPPGPVVMGGVGLRGGRGREWRGAALASRRFGGTLHAGGWAWALGRSGPRDNSRSGAALGSKGVARTLKTRVIPTALGLGAAIVLTGLVGGARMAPASNGAGAAGKPAALLIPAKARLIIGYSRIALA